jgi:hypothetical protein
VKRIEEAQQKALGEALELLEVHSGGAQDGAYGITERAFESVSFEAMFTFHVSDGRFDCGAPFHPSA